MVITAIMLPMAISSAHATPTTSIYSIVVAKSSAVAEHGMEPLIIVKVLMPMLMASGETNQVEP